MPRICCLQYAGRTVRPRKSIGCRVDNERGKLMTRICWRLVVAFAPLALLAACESFGRGVTQAVLEGTSATGEDTRNCEVEGRPFPGIEPYLAGPGQAAAVRRGRSATGPRSRCSTSTASAPTRRATARRCARTWPTSLGLDDPGPAAEADRDRPPEVPGPEPGRDQRLPAHRRPSIGATSCSTS